MNTIKDRFIGAVIGLVAGLLTWVAIALIFYLLHELLQPSHARFRVPIVMVIAPFVGVFLGFASGPQIVAAVKGWMGGKDPKYDTHQALINQMIEGSGPNFWRLVLNAVCDLHHNKVVDYGATYFSNIFSKTTNKKVRKEFEEEMLLLYDQKMHSGLSSSAVALGALMWAVSVKAVDDPEYAKLAKRVWNAAVDSGHESARFDEEVMYPAHLK